jgi:hypothetical protein
MPFVRRTVAVLSSLFLLQLTLLGSGTLCAMHHGATGIDRAEHSMRGMAGIVASPTPSPESAVLAATDGNSSVSPSDYNGPTDHDGCRLPWAPGQCSSMTTCGVTVAPAALIVALSAPRTASVDIAAPELVRAGPSFAPELPPPRA